MATCENQGGETGTIGSALEVDDDTWRQIKQTVRGLKYSFEGAPSEYIYKLDALRGGELGVFDPEKEEYGDPLVDTGARSARLQPADTGFADLSDPVTALARTLYDGGSSSEEDREYQTRWHKVKAELRAYDACKEGEPGGSLQQFVQEFHEQLSF